MSRKVKSKQYACAGEYDVAENENLRALLLIKIKALEKVIVWDFPAALTSLKSNINRTDIRMSHIWFVRFFWAVSLVDGSYPELNTKKWQLVIARWSFHSKTTCCLRKITWYAFGYILNELKLPLCWPWHVCKRGPDNIYPYGQRILNWGNQVVTITGSGNATRCWSRSQR